MGLLHHSTDDPPFEVERPGEREGRLVQENHQLRMLVGELRRSNDRLKLDLGCVNRSLDQVMADLAKKRHK